jgi:hypothetical protein
MENQHRKINGYRELSQVEIDLMNEVKQKGVELEHLIKRIHKHINDQALIAFKEPDDVEARRIQSAAPSKWLREGTTQLQLGLMELTRSIAQPTFF